MKLTKALAHFGAATVLAAGGAFVAAGTAHATDGDVYARVYTTGESGGSTRSYLDFTGARTMVFRDFIVNDICPGDGIPVSGQGMVKFMDGTVWTGPKHWDDTTCDSTSSGVDFGDLPFSTDSHQIKEAWVRVCANGQCAASQHRDNPYT